MNIINRLLPTIRVHSWGGFGSQLFTAHLILRLKSRFPGRKIKVIIHTSGVTQRFTELNFNQLGVGVSEVNDFSKKVKITNSMHQRELRRNLRKLLLVQAKWLLKKLHLVEDCNTEASFNLIKPWTLHLRGHYTGLHLDLEIVNSLYSLLFKKFDLLGLRSSSVIVHYRLGDLLVLEEKTPIAPNRVKSILTSLKYNADVIMVLTDSNANEFKKYVSGDKFLSSLSVARLDPIASILACISTEVFVGTTTKISLWIAIFRNIFFKQNNYLPHELDWAKDIGLHAEWY